MSSATARQWQRVDYHVPVQLHRHASDGQTSSQTTQDGERTANVAAAGTDRTLVAQAINVSEGGMQIATNGTLPIGEGVTCSLLLEGRQASLPGRVRWSQPAVPGLGAPGVGIQFDDLSDADSSLLKLAVTRAAHGDQPVELYFAGMTEPVIARAKASEHGLHIGAALPVLTHDSQVEFRFAGAGPRFFGRVAQVRVRERQGTPHIEVDLAVLSHEMPRFRRYTMYSDESGTRQLPRRGDGAGADGGLEHSERERNETLQFWNPRAQASDAAAEATSQPAAISGGVAQPAGAPSREQSSKYALAGKDLARDERSLLGERERTTERFWRQPSRVARQIALLLLAAVFGSLTTWLVMAPTARPPELSAGLASPQPAANEGAVNVLRPLAPPEDRAGEVAATVEAASAPAVAAPIDEPTLGPAAASAEDVAPTEQAAVIAQPSAEPTTGSAESGTLGVTVDGHTLHVLVPLTGRGDGARATRWAVPSAIVVDLPHAGVALPKSQYTLAKEAKSGDAQLLPSAFRLALLRNHGVTHVRLFVDANVRKHSVAVHDQTLELIAEPVFFVASPTR